MPDHVLTDTSLTDMDTELEQFPVNMWRSRSPQWILAAQHADQLANLCRHRRATGLAAVNLPATE